MAYRAHVKFVFHDVGQGLFYSGEIKPERDNKFDFVYDCGSTNKKQLKTIVSRYKCTALSDKNRLNMLVISHLHEDHVSGLDELLKGLRVDYVFLPYFPPIERLILALMYEGADEWYYSFLSDPVSYLLENYNIHRIILIDGGEEGEGGLGEPPSDIPPRPGDKPEDEGDKEIKIKLYDNKKLKTRIEELEDKVYFSYINCRRLLIKRDDGYVVWKGLWLFQFFNYKLPIEKLNEFYMCIKAHLNPSSSNSEQVDIEKKKLKDAITNKSMRKNLRGCYKKLQRFLNNDFNNTSLMMLHTPLNVTRCHCHRIGKLPCICYDDERWFWCPTPLHPPHPCFGHLMTGDIDLNYRFNEIIQHFRSHIENVRIVQVPHHGACKNWNSKIFKHISWPSLWVVSAGIRNPYKHPHRSVICDILEREHCLAWSNEENEVVIEGGAIWR